VSPGPGDRERDSAWPLGAESPPTGRRGTVAARSPRLGAGTSGGVSGGLSGTGSLFDAPVPGGSPDTAVAVSTLTLSVKQVLERAVRPLWIRGEVIDFKAHRNGHWYFALRDETAQLRCVVWASDQRGIPARPDDGMAVVVFGHLTMYAVRGDVQLRVTAMEATGDGLRRKALERTLEALRRDGLLAPERKRPLPRLPRCLAVITSPDGAALHDILAVARRRAPSLRIIVVASRVQGEGAPEELCAALARLGRWGKADVVIVGRGGGAKEDLGAFNDERVARAVAACHAPTVSAVGHEIDTTMCDLVADCRAATPSAAAECAVPLWADEAQRLRIVGSQIVDIAERRIEAARRRLSRVGELTRAGAMRSAERRRSRLDGAAGRLDALSPLATLARGFAVARDAEGHALTVTADFAPGVAFDLTIRDGVVGAVTASVSPTLTTEQP
jgi:exodeoxyribonuclease VII large subunit